MACQSFFKFDVGLNLCEVNKITPNNHNRKPYKFFGFLSKVSNLAQLGDLSNNKLYDILPVRKIAEIK
jgi:hypothetical protein